MKSNEASCQPNHQLNLRLGSQRNAAASNGMTINAVMKISGWWPIHSLISAAYY